MNIDRERNGFAMLIWAADGSMEIKDVKRRLRDA
jgi:hypothetical protein